MENLNLTKRKRSTNWTPEMVELLISMVKPVSAIIDSKMNNLTMIKKKSEAWENIKFAFEANGYSVSKKQLRDQWNRRKQVSRNKISTYKRAQRQTGGGSPPKEPDEMDYEIEEIAKDDFMEDFSAYDCDTFYEPEETENELPNKKTQFEILEIEKLETESQPKSNVKTKMNPPKRATVNKRRVFSTTATSEELLQKRILQVEYETKANKVILQLKEKKERLKIQVQKRKLCLLKMQIRNFQNNI